VICLHSLNSRKIAFVARVYGHLEAFHIPFIKLLKAKGYVVHAFAALDHGKEALEREGVICHDTPFYRDLSLKNLLLINRLTKEFRNERFEIVHCNTPIAAFVGRIAAKRAGIPVVIYTAHGFHFCKGGSLLSWLIYYPLEYFAAHFTDYLITINLEDFHIAKKFPVRKKVMYVPGVGVDTNSFQILLNDRESLREDLGINPNEFLILHVAELNNNKNHIQLIKVIELLIKNAVPVKCYMAGTGDLKTALEEEIKVRGLEEYIQLLGFRTDIPQLMASCDLVVLVSKREGLPKSLMEAMAAGKPIVATNVRGCRDLVTSGNNGFLVPVGDVKNTTEAILTIMNNVHLREKMGLSNLEKVKQYNLENIKIIMDEFYSQAIERKLK
jgi:glycosyltransferase involved in cell wall biosynthesis